MPSSSPEGNWTALEIWEPDRDYDLVLMGEVLKHMAKAEAQACVLKLLHHTTLLLISIPIVEMPPDEVEENPDERHVKADWCHEEVLASFPNVSLAYVGEELGVYLLSSNQGVHEVVQFLIADLPSEFFTNLG